MVELAGHILDCKTGHFDAGKLKVPKLQSPPASILRPPGAGLDGTHYSRAYSPSPPLLAHHARYRLRSVVLAKLIEKATRC